MSDRRERIDNLVELLTMKIEAEQSHLWTALPGKIVSFNAEQMTVVVQPTIKAMVPDPATGEYVSTPLPNLLDVPVLWQGGGGMTLTFPIAAGNECLVIISARCISGWWATGQVADPPVLRMHNLSDAFALVGVRSLPRTFNVDTTQVQLRSDDGSFTWNMNPTAKTIAAVATGGITLNGVTIDGTGQQVNTPGNLSVGNGATGTFTSASGQVITVQDGIVTNID